MDAEMFTTGGAVYRTRKIDKEDEGITETNVDYQLKIAKYKFSHALKLLVRLLTILALVMIVWVVALTIPTWVNTWSTTKWGKSKFSQQENLQWLGASTNVIRGDYENNQDSLAETALKNDQRITDIAEKKATFLSRERLTTPEEELLKKISQ